MKGYMRMGSMLEEARAIINEVDSQMAELFVKRMRAAEMVYEHKKMFGLPILDQARENAVIEKNTELIEDESLKGYYVEFIKNMMSISREYQYQMQSSSKLIDDSDESRVNLHIDLKENSYDIIVERGILANAAKHLHLNRRVLVVTDSGVPATYAQSIASQCANPVICTVETGEGSKSLTVLGQLWQTMLDHDFSRKDCVCCGGGVGLVGMYVSLFLSYFMPHLVGWLIFHAKKRAKVLLFFELTKFLCEKMSFYQIFLCMCFFCCTFVCHFGRYPASEH